MRTKKTLKEKLVNKIMKEVYNTDDIKYYDSNLNYLNSLTVEELIMIAQKNDLI